jgi:predicted  nucleic acid-binding Zn-ribbon protein
VGHGPRAAVVRTYERRIARDVREVYELRRSAIELEGKLDDLHSTDGQRAAELAEQVAQLESDLAGIEEREARAAATLTELLRLRDLLIVAERDVGQARGEIQSLNDTLRGYHTLADRHHEVIHSTIWQTQWKVLAPYRKLRGRLGR